MDCKLLQWKLQDLVITERICFKIWRLLLGEWYSKIIEIVLRYVILPFFTWTLPALTKHKCFLDLPCVTVLPSCFPYSYLTIPSLLLPCYTYCLICPSLSFVPCHLSCVLCLTLAYSNVNSVAYLTTLLSA